MWDMVIVLFVVGLALLFVIRRLKRSVKSASGGCCSGCDGCPASSADCGERLRPMRTSDDPPTRADGEIRRPRL